MDNNSGVENLLDGGSSSSSNPNPANNSNNGGESGTPAPAPKFKTSDGREFNLEELGKEYESLHGDYTRKSQELAKLKEPSDNGNSNNSDDSDLTDPKDRELAAEIRRLGFVRKNDAVKIADDRLAEKEPGILESASKRGLSAAKLDNALEDLTVDFDGSAEDINGVKINKPKVDKDVILKWIVEHNPSPEMSVLDIAHQVYYNDFVKYDAQKLAGGVSTPSLPTTESNGAGVNSTPPDKPVLKFNDGSAARAAQEILDKGTQK